MQDGRTPLHYAAVLPDKQIYQILETTNASKETKDRFGYTPRDYLTNDQLTIRELLIKYSGKDVPNGKKADLWERPPTSEIISRRRGRELRVDLKVIDPPVVLTPDTGSVPSTANEEQTKNEEDGPRTKENTAEDEGTSSQGKTVQILQIEPRARYSLELEEEMPAETGKGADAFSTVQSEETVQLTDAQRESHVEKAPVDVAEREPRQVSEENTPEVVKGDTSLAQRNRIKRMQTFDRSDSNTMKRQSSKNSEASPSGDDNTFEAMSNEFSRSLRNEKIRLQKSIDRQLSSTNVIKPGGNNGSVIDSIQDASRPNIGGASRISNGLSAAGYDLTQIKDEHGRTVRNIFPYFHIILSLITERFLFIPRCCTLLQPRTRSEIFSIKCFSKPTI